ncbi:uncharacterized protein LOC122057000 [Macadamia integrifolia]|uniref:uncharacterized protein LOC122057000 n=1 Tax=Macadamia integrifolia TaxID=60698 RepID=UPI001C52F23D|nr:uncharacterized protein LOC122057000 [Macadamia integrifolia]
MILQYGQCNSWPQEFRFTDLLYQVITEGQNQFPVASNSPDVNVPIEQNVSLDLKLAPQPGRGNGTTYEQPLPDLTLRLGGGSGNSRRAQMNNLGTVATASRAYIPRVYAPYYETLGLPIDPFMRAFLGNIPGENCHNQAKIQPNLMSSQLPSGAPLQFGHPVSPFGPHRSTHFELAKGPTNLPPSDAQLPPLANRTNFQDFNEPISYLSLLMSFAPQFPRDIGFQFHQDSEVPLDQQKEQQQNQQEK